MNRRSRKTVFVCCAVADGNAISKTIEAKTPEEAHQKFEEENKVKATDCHGPFTAKKVAKRVETTTSVVFAGGSKNAIYNNWYVKALFTSEPHNCAYLLFDKRVDGKKVPKPQGTFIVKMDYLEEIK